MVKRLRRNMDTMDDNTRLPAVHTVHIVHIVHIVHSSLREQQLLLALIHVSPFQGFDFGGALAPGSASLHLGLLMVSALRACFSMNTIR